MLLDVDAARVFSHVMDENIVTLLRDKWYSGEDLLYKDVKFQSWCCGISMFPLPLNSE